MGLRRLLFFDVRTANSRRLSLSLSLFHKSLRWTLSKSNTFPYTRVFEFRQILRSKNREIKKIKDQNTFTFPVFRILAFFVFIVSLTLKETQAELSLSLLALFYFQETHFSVRSQRDSASKPSR